MKEFVCDKCGSSISIGTMFCPVCGTRPDPIAMEENARAVPSRNWLPKIRWTVVGAVLFGVIAVSAMLLFWPNADNVGLKGDKRNAQYFLSQIQAVKMIDQERSLTVTLNESDINAYLEFVRVPKAKVDFCSTELIPDLVHVRFWKRSGPYKCFKFQFSPRVSVDIWYKALDTGFRVSKVYVGHLPIAGSFKYMVADRVKGMVLGDFKQKGLLDNIASIKINNEHLVITVKKDSSSHR